MQSQGALAFITRVTKPFSIYIAGMIFVSFMWALLVNLQPYIGKLILNSAMDGYENNVFNGLGTLLVLYFISECIYVVIFRFYDWLTMRLRPVLKRHIILILMDYMLSHSHSFYQHQFAGGLTTRIIDIAKGIPDILRIVIDRLLACSLMLLFALYNVSRIDIKFTIALAIWVFVFLGLSIILAFRNQHLAYQVADARATVVGSVVDVLTNMMNVRLFAGKKFENRYLARFVDDSVQKDQTRDWFFLKLHALQGISYLIFQMICFWWLFNGLLSKTVTPGDFVLVLTLNLYIVDNIWNIAKEMREFWEKLGDVVQGLAIIQTPIEIQDKSDAQKLVVTQG